MHALYGNRGSGSAAIEAALMLLGTPITSGCLTIAVADA